MNWETNSLIELLPTPNPSHLREPNEMHPTAWFTRKELEQPPHVLNPLAAEYTPQTEAPHTTENCERPTSFLNHLATEFEPKEPTPSSHPHQNQSEETDTDEPE